MQIVSRIRPQLLGLSLVLALGAGPATAQSAKALAPIPAATLALMAVKGTTASAPVLFRAYKKESEIEVWKRATNGRFVFIRSYPICRWSGQLGPKTRSGDRQTPEGFYTVAKGQMNPNSKYYLSFDVGYPNAYDRAHGATGSAVMVHGICSSMGCFAMTDQVAGELFSIARDAFGGGQTAFQFQSFPFRMSAANMARHRTDPNIGFWRQLKEGSDRFEAGGEELAVSVSGGRYVFAPLADSQREAAVQAHRTVEEARIAGLVEDGAAAVRTTYSDGGQHAFWAALIGRGVSVGEISRPEALAYAGQEVVVIAARHRPTSVPVPEAVWAPWIAPGTRFVPHGVAGFVPLYERAVPRFPAPATRYADTWPSILRDTVDGRLSDPGFRGAMRMAEMVVQR